MKQVMIKRRVLREGGFIETSEKATVVSETGGSVSVRLGNGDVIKRKRKDVEEISL